MTKERTVSENPEPREVLKYILGRIYRARHRQVQLDRSLADLSAWIAAPIGGSNYSPTPRAHGQSCAVGDKMLMRMVELEDSIAEQKARLVEGAAVVMEIVALLPPESIERTVCEMRHVSLLSWDEIAGRIPMSRRHVARIYDGALDALLVCPKVQTAIAAARTEYTQWALVRTATQKQWKNKVGGQTRKTKPEKKTGNPRGKS